MKTNFLLTSALILSLVSPAMAQETDNSQEARRAAFDDCLTSLGIERPAEGERPQVPQDDVREQIDACMLEKGYEAPKHRHQGPPPDGERRGGPRGSRGAR